VSEDCEWNPNWWREAMAASLERKQRAVNASALAQPGDTFLIVTEGVVTEPVYFDLLLGELQLASARIKIIPGDHSDPRHVIRTAKREAEEQVRKAEKDMLGINEPANFDHVWAVIDTDVAVRQGFWNDVQQLARANKVQLAHSTPCIEFWLLLHIDGYTTRSDLVDGTAAKSAVRHALGEDYSSNKEIAKNVFPTFVSNWPEAVAHAEQVRHYHQGVTPPPANPSTEVDRLVRALNDSALPYQRKL
jgi:hypothetical protein